MNRPPIRHQSALGIWQHDEVLQLHHALTRQSLDGQSLEHGTLPPHFAIDGSSLEKLDSVGLAALCMLIEQANHQAQQTAQPVEYSWHNMPLVFEQLVRLYHLDFLLNPNDPA